MNAFVIAPITNFNEITHHFLECIYHHEMNTIFPPKPHNKIESNVAISVPFKNIIQSNQLLNGNNNNSNDISDGDMYDDLSPIQRAILKLINTPAINDSSNGIHVESIFIQCAHENIDDLREAIGELEDGSYIYSTIDEEHFKYMGSQG